MDFASLFGIISGLALIISAIFFGGELDQFINTPGFMIVVGGTLAATLLTFRFSHVMTAMRAAYMVFTRQSDDTQKTVETLLKMRATVARRGPMALQDVKTSSGFIRRACGMIADTASEEVVRESMQAEIESLMARHFVVQDVFKKMGIYAPSFGMLGTLIGLIQMLGQLEDPSQVGPAMAIALLTTFYGSLLAFMVFVPIAGKLKARTMDEVTKLEMIREGVISIRKQEKATDLQDRLSAYLPEKKRQVIRLAFEKTRKERAA